MFVILDRVDARSRRAAGLAERRGQDDLSGSSRPDEADHGGPQAGALGRVSPAGDEPDTFAEALDLGLPSVMEPRAGRLERELAALERDGALDPRYAGLQHRFDAHGGYCSTSAWTRRSPVSFLSSMWDRPPRRSPAAADARRVSRAPHLRSGPAPRRPTNHLDISALEWLEEEMRRPRALLVASTTGRSSTEWSGASGSCGPPAHDVPG
jgi:hypothetical protein